MMYEETNPANLTKNELKKIRGVYFLYRGEEIVYIGQSINITKRIWTHASEKEFDSYRYI